MMLSGSCGSCRAGCAVRGLIRVGRHSRPHAKWTASAETCIRKKSLEQAGRALDEKREMILLLREQFPINKRCEVLGVPRSGAYDEPRPDEDRLLLDALTEVAGQWPTYGYRRLTNSRPVSGAH